jgi:hypothetical protein
MATPNVGRADLLIELASEQFQAQRVLIRAPRARLEMADGTYRLFDREREAMVTVLPEHGVFYREDPRKLAQTHQRFVRRLRENEQQLSEDIDAAAPTAVQQQWQALRERWRLDVTSSDLQRAPLAIVSLTDQADPARAGGFECRLVKAELEHYDHSVRACLVGAEAIGAGQRDLELLESLFWYLDRLRTATAPAAQDDPGVTPGLIARLMDHSGELVLGAARWTRTDEQARGTRWQVDDVWSAFLEPGQFRVAEDHTMVKPPYARARSHR